MDLPNFSLKEIKEAGLTKGQLKEKKVKIDYRRKSIIPKNLELLSQLGIKPLPGRKAIKKAVPKKVKPSAPKPKVTKEKVKAEPVKKPVKKAAEKVPAVKAAVKKPAKAADAQKALSDLGAITNGMVEKLHAVGINTCKELVDGILTIDDIRSVSKATKITQKQLKAWKAEIQK